jgi:hypothetical protein
MWREDPALREWLAAEEADEPAAAEAALTRLFERLPRPAPAPGFVPRTLARAAVEVPRARAVARARRVLRRLAAAALAGLALALVFLPVLVRRLSAGPALTELSLADLMGRLAAAVAAASHLLRDALVAFQKANDWLPGLAGEANRPGVAAGALAALLLAALLLRAVAPLLDRHRSFPYASA